MKKAKSAKPKRRAQVKRRRPVRDISTDGQLEVRGNEVIFYEPLKTEIAQICKNKNITLQQYWDELCFSLRLKAAKAARNYMSKTQRKARTGEMR